MGPVHVVRAHPERIPTWSIREDELDAELARLHRAIHVVTERLEERKRRVALQAGEKDAEIFAVHRMILEDPLARRRLESQLRDERLNAEVCVQALVDRLVETLGGLEGNNVRSYGADVADPWRAVLDELMSRATEDFVSSGEKVVLAAAELTPHVVSLLDRDRVLAIVTETGGRFSHGAVLARSFGYACVVELPNLLSRLEQGLRVIVDGDAGTVQLAPSDKDVDAFLERLERRVAWVDELKADALLPSETTDDVRVQVQVNIESLRDLDTFDLEHIDGVGLLRTEFLYMERSQFPSEEEQYRLYRRAVERMGGRSLTLRTLDIGGDKQLPYFKMPKEANPALGWRGLRVSLEWQDLLNVQLRAALRASAHGNLRILLPMVTSVEEVQRVHQIFNRVRAQLIDHGYEVAADVPVGVMIEVPSAVLVLDAILEEADFISVGTNDLVQYLLAADRDNPWVSRLYDPYHPAVMISLSQIASATRAAGKHSSVCGEMAGDYATALVLFGMGYDAVSVSPHFVAEVKHAVRQVAMTDLEQLAGRVRVARSGAEVRAALEGLRAHLHDHQPEDDAFGVGGDTSGRSVK
jgi:phosphotransferase system enzyme I (PtsI)